MNIRRGWFYIGTLVLLGGGLWSSGAARADSQSLTISPSAVNLVVDPGSVHRGSFELINGGISQYAIRIHALPYSVMGENYSPDYSVLAGTPNIANWLSFSTADVTLPPAESINVDYTLAVPPHTLPGGYYGVVFAEIQLPGVTQGVIVNEQVGEIFYVQVAGPAKKTGQVLTWQVNAFQQLPLSGFVRLENSGSVHYFSNIQITVSDILGDSKYTYSTQKAVLPQTVRRVDVAWDGAPSIGLFKVNGSATVFGVTKTLPTKYVLVLSKSAQVVILTIVILLLLFTGLRYAFSKPSRAKKGRPKS